MFLINGGIYLTYMSRFINVIYFTYQISPCLQFYDRDSLRSVMEFFVCVCVCV